MPKRPPSRCTNPTCRTLVDRPGRCRTCRQGTNDAHRTEWKWIYNDPRWHALRDRVLSEEPVCACGCGAPPTVVDHITPHRGNERLAFDRTNCQAMTRRCHDAKTATETLNAPGRDTVTVILGPPCSGKTSTAHTLANPARDIVIDLDALAQALTPHPAKSPHTSDPPTPARPPTLNRPPLTPRTPGPATLDRGHTAGHTRAQPTRRGLRQRSTRRAHTTARPLPSRPARVDRDDEARRRRRCSWRSRDATRRRRRRVQATRERGRSSGEVARADRGMVHRRPNPRGARRLSVTGGGPKVQPMRALRTRGVGERT